MSGKYISTLHLRSLGHLLFVASMLSALIVRLCWFARAKLIKFAKEWLLGAPSCMGLHGQVLVELM